MKTPADPAIATVNADGLHSYVAWRYGIPARTLRKVDPELLRPVVGLLANSGVLFPEEVAGWLITRNERLGWARPIVLLRHRNPASFERVSDAALAHVRALEGRA